MVGLDYTLHQKFSQKNFFYDSCSLSFTVITSKKGTWVRSSCACYFLVDLMMLESTMFSIILAS
uniref:Uncharacterized protein n=1 Tax=Arundo donax TaxID=35708 RepID=A0A0A9G6G3_ARUDO